MTRRRAALAAVVAAGAIALAGLGVSHPGQTSATQSVVVPDRSLAAELDVSGDQTVLFAALRRTDQEQAGAEMSGVLV